MNLKTLLEMVEDTTLCDKLFQVIVDHIAVDEKIDQDALAAAILHIASTLVFSLKFHALMVRDDPNSEKRLGALLELIRGQWKRYDITEPMINTLNNEEPSTLH